MHGFSTKTASESRKNKSDAETSSSMTWRFRSGFCHPKPGPELDSGSIDFSISVLGFRI
jgi:hypothetical protein